MSIPTPASFVDKKDGVYWVLGYEPSDSNPDVQYEIRTSMRNGKTYCNCTSCNMSYHKAGGDGTAKCKHLLRFTKRNPTVKIELMDLEGYLSVRRAVVVVDTIDVSTKNKVRRNKI